MSSILSPEPDATTPRSLISLASSWVDSASFLSTTRLRTPPGSPNFSIVV